MPGMDAFEMSDNLAAGEIEIADGIKNFVADEFIIITQAVFIENLVAADDDGVIKRAAKGKAVGAKVIDLMEKAEGAGTGDFGFEIAIDHLEVIGLMGNGIDLKVDFAMNGKNISRCM